MQPLLEEMSQSITVFDALDGQFHTCTPLLIFGTFDLRGLPKISMGNQPPAKCGCHECQFKGTWCPAAHTTVYTGHYQFANKEDRLRSLDLSLSSLSLSLSSKPPKTKKTKTLRSRPGLPPRHSAAPDLFGSRKALSQGSRLSGLSVGHCRLALASPIRHYLAGRRAHPRREMRRTEPGADRRDAPGFLRRARRAL